MGCDSLHPTASQRRASNGGVACRWILPCHQPFITLCLEFLQHSYLFPCRANLYDTTFFNHPLMP